ncbi:MAG: hypothetical protein CML13_11835 [Puniceicoccaceae bacterium]|nr:hypothetical protein [Puniceicoccaceae bacterium]
MASRQLSVTDVLVLSVTDVFVPRQMTPLEASVEKTDEVESCIRKNPWKSIGIAVVAGIVIDRLTSRHK